MMQVPRARYRRITQWAMSLATALTSTGAAATDVWPGALRIAMQRTADVEWRLQEAAGTTCPAMTTATGIVLDSLDSYAPADRPMVAGSLGLTELPQVAAVASGSPAAQAGILAGDAVVSVEGLEIPQPGAPQPGPAQGVAGPTLALRMSAALAALPPQAPVHMTVLRHDSDMTVEVIPVLHCSSRIFVDTQNSLRAYSDGSDIVITARMVDFARTQDELAILAGHELGHVIARHGKAHGLKQQRLMEDHADVIGADLAACAGYDPQSAAPFWERLEKTQPLRWLAIAMQSSGKMRTRNVHDRARPRSCPIAVVPSLDG